jgi:tRNA pseudouridine38-40 synthase
MQKYFGFISYNGKYFSGSQDQNSALISTVQSNLQEAINKVFSKFNTEFSVRLASRTDKNVHAYKNAFDFFLKFDKNNPNHQTYPSSIVKKSLNSYFRKISYSQNDYINIFIPEVYLCENNFDSRADATSRTYIYKIYYKPLNTQEESQDYLFMKNYYYYISSASESLHKKLDLGKIEEITKLFVGQEYDFSNFMKIDKSVYYNPIRKINKIDVKIEEDFIYKNCYRIYLIIESKSFLRNQIRLMVNIILDYACGKCKYEEVKNYLLMNKTWENKYPAPAEGLYLADIKYDESKYNLHIELNESLEKEYIVFRDKMFNKKH